MPTELEHDVGDLPDRGTAAAELGRHEDGEEGSIAQRVKCLGWKAGVAIHLTGGGAGHLRADVRRLSREFVAERLRGRH